MTSEQKIVIRHVRRLVGHRRSVNLSVGHWRTANLAETSPEDTLLRRLEGLAFSFLVMLDSLAIDVDRDVVERAMTHGMPLHELFSQDKDIENVAPARSVGDGVIVELAEIRERLELIEAQLKAVEAVASEDTEAKAMAAAGIEYSEEP